MPFLLYLIIGTAMISQFGELRSLLGPVGRGLVLLPEILAGLLLVPVLLTIGRQKQLAISPKYVVVALILILHMILGGILNTVSPGAFAWGIRIYFAFIPLFLLPAVYEFTESQILSVQKFILAMALLQVPVSLYQRIFIFPTTPSGDVVRGMFQSGAIMSIFLVSVVTVMVAMFLKGYLTRKWIISLCPLLLIPTMINETKGTVVLLPIALLSVAYFLSRATKRLRVLVGALSLSAIFVIIFAAAYDIYFPHEDGQFRLLTFFTDEAINNIYKDHEAPKVGRVGRVDSVLYAHRKLVNDPAKLAFGLGIGNVTSPGTLEIVEGEYSEYYETYGASTTTYASLLWSIGAVGILLSLLILFMLFQDIKRLAVDEGLLGAMSLGWCGIVVMLPIAFLYKDLVYSGAIVSVTMFFLGFFASRSLVPATAVQPINRLQKPGDYKTEFTSQIPL